jgi:hypothetical protein
MIFADPDRPRGIVWIASYPKSGNTWVRVFLYHLMRLRAGRPRQADELNRLDRSSPYEMRMFGLFEEFLGKKLATATQDEVSRVRPKVHEAIARRRDGLALVKTHTLLGRLSGVSTINLAVSAGTIYIVRDPRDIASSLADHLGVSVDEAIEVMATPGSGTGNDVETAFEMWGTWSEHVLSWTAQAHDAVLVLRYEDLIADPVKHFTRAVRHLRWKPVAGQIARAVELSSFDRLRDAEDRQGFSERSGPATRFFRKGEAGSWRQTLTDDQAARIAAGHAQQMKRFGYLD